MRKLLLPLWIGNLSLYAEETTTEPITVSLLWLIISLLIVVLFFWGMYKVVTTKNPKYGYVILVAGILMLASVFI
jgi:uncharacterized BrkB/YihY/UPF0761 family membrane protein